MKSNKYEERAPKILFKAADLLKIALLNNISDFSPKQRTASSIILRGPNDFYCDEMERSIHDALCVVKRVLESKTVVAGGGAVEVALSIYLENFATTLVSVLCPCSSKNALIVLSKFYRGTVKSKFEEGK